MLSALVLGLDGLRLTGGAGACHGDDASSSTPGQPSALFYGTSVSGREYLSSPVGDRLKKKAAHILGFQLSSRSKRIQLTFTQSSHTSTFLPWLANFLSDAPRN